MREGVRRTKLHRRVVRRRQDDHDQRSNRSEDTRGIAQGGLKGLESDNVSGLG